MKKFLVLLVFIISFILANAQNQISVYALPTGYTNLQLKIRNALHVDAYNNKWIGFNTVGLGRFDGSVWTMFDTANSSLPSNHVYAVSSYNTSLWVGTSAGLSKYDGTTFTNYNHLNSPLPNDRVTAVALQGSIVWVGTLQGLFKYDGNTWQSFTTANGLVNDAIQCIAISPSNEVWIGTIGGISLLTNNTFVNYTSATSNLTSNFIQCITITKSNDVWIGTRGEGALKFDNGNFIAMEDLLLNNPNNCSYEKYFNGDVYAIATDTLSNIFLELYSSNGNKDILKISASNSNYYVLQDTSNTYSSTSKKLMQADVNGTIWIIGYTPLFNINYLYALDISTIIGKDIYQANNFGGNDLNINQVRTRLLNLGDMHWDPVSSINHYEVPLCSARNSVFASALWLGGLDAGGLLHTAAMTYRQQGVDFFAGPLDTITGTADSSNLAQYNRLWKVDRNMIYWFQQNFANGNVANGTYLIPEPILTWPAHGTGNYTRKLAPYIDFNSDGVYNPMDGDYPAIKGDQMLWWVFNDTLSQHRETRGPAFGFEIHGEAYAFTCPTSTITNEAINYTTYYKYTIINRSPNTYHDMYIGLWCDEDLGDATDDYVGCDTTLDAAFVYNGDNDDDVSAGGYGLNPPMQNILILKGPLADLNDGIDNNRNGVMDEVGETIGISHFMYYKNTNSTPDGNPAFATDYYQYLKGAWKDSLPVTYGGDGRSNQTNPATDFMFPGTPYDTDWTMSNVGISPNDMRNVMSSGTFTIAPDEERTIDFAYLFTRDNSAPNGLTTSIAKNRADIINVRQWFYNNNFPTCFNVSVDEVKNTNGLTIYPNPTNTGCTITAPAFSNSTLTIYDITGRVLSRKPFNTKAELDMSALTTGMYILELIDKEGRSVKGKLVKE